MHILIYLSKYKNYLQPHLLHIIDNRPSLNEDTLCGILMQGSNCILTAIDDYDFSVTIAPGGTPITVGY